MGIFSRFEGKMEDTFEGAASKMFNAPISPVQIAKKAEKQMRRESNKMVGAGKQYAPTLYTVLVNADDDKRLFGYYPTLAGETETYLAAKANELGLYMDGQPLVRFIVDESLRRGKFDVIAETVASPIISQLRDEEMQRYGLANAQVNVASYGQQFSRQASEASAEQAANAVAEAEAKNATPIHHPAYTSNGEQAFSYAAPSQQEPTYFPVDNLESYADNEENIYEVDNVAPGGAVMNPFQTPRQRRAARAAAGERAPFLSKKASPVVTPPSMQPVEGAEPNFTDLDYDLQYEDEPYDETYDADYDADFGDSYDNAGVSASAAEEPQPQSAQEDETEAAEEEYDQNQYSQDEYDQDQYDQDEYDQDEAADQLYDDGQYSEALYNEEPDELIAAASAAFEKSLDDSGLDVDTPPSDLDDEEYSSSFGVGSASSAAAPAAASAATAAAAQNYDDTVMFSGGGQQAQQQHNYLQPRGQLVDIATHRSFNLTGNHLIVGRESKNDITVSDINVSRQHADLRWDPRGVWILTDLGSTNGTYVNGSPIASKALQDGDRITFGVTDFLFRQQ